jgi:hypothetical protein
MKEISTLNFKNKLNKLFKIVQPWQGNKLTIYGKQPLEIHTVTVYLSNVSTTNTCRNLFIKNINKKYSNLYGKWLNLKAMNQSLKASLNPKLYFNKEWFSSRLVENAHPMFEKKNNFHSYKFNLQIFL